MDGYPGSENHQLGRLIAQVEQLSFQLVRLDDKIDRTITAIEARLRSNEQNISTLRGLGVAGFLIWSVVLLLVEYFLKR